MIDYKNEKVGKNRKGLKTKTEKIRSTLNYSKGLRNILDEKKTPAEELKFRNPKTYIKKNGARD